MSGIPASQSSDRDEYIDVANDLFRKFNLPTVRELRECSASTFISLYEGILGERLKGVVSNPVAREDDIHNVQCMVDSLASDVLHCDLSHITGQAVVNGDAITIRYLLEILEGLVEYVMEQINSETSTETDDFRPLHEEQASRLLSQISAEGSVSRGTIDGLPQRADHMARTRSLDSLSLPSSISVHREADVLSEASDSTAELIKLGEESASHRSRHTKRKPKDARDSTGGALLNNTFDKSEHTVTGHRSFDISEGRLSQLIETTMTDVQRPPPATVSSSFSTVSWPKAPSTASSPSILSKPATGSNIGQRPGSKAFMAERLSPYNRLLESLLSQSSLTATSSRDMDSLGDDLETVPSPSGVTKAAASNGRPHRSRRTTPQPDAGMGVRSSEQGSAATPQLDSSRRKSHRNEGPKVSQRRSPRFTPPTKLGANENESAKAQDVEHSDLGKGRQYAAATIYSSGYPAMLPHQRPSPRPGSASAEIDGHRLKNVAATSGQSTHHRQQQQRGNFAPATSGYSRGKSTTATAADSEQETYPAKLPPRARATGRRSDDFSLDSSTIRPESGVDELLGSREVGRSEVAGRGSSLISDLEDTYDRSFMQRKVARKRRVAFEDEVTGSPGSSRGQGQPSRRFRPSRSSGDEEDADWEVPYSSHGDPHARENRLSLGDDDEEEEEGEEHSSRNIGERSKRSSGYHLRPRKKPVVQGKRRGARVPSQRGVLLPRSASPKMRAPLKAVHFEDAINQDARGMMGKVRRRLAQETQEQDRLKTALHHSYATDLREVKRGVSAQVRRRKRVAKQMDSQYKAIHGQPKTTKYKPAKKYNVPIVQTSTTGGSRRSVRTTAKRSSSPPVLRRGRSASLEPTPSTSSAGERPLRVGDDDLLPTLMHEFPFLHVSPHSAQRMWSQQMKHMEHLTKMALSHQQRKPKSQSKIEEAEKKQEILVSIMKKELAHNERMREIKERRNQEKVLRSKAAEQRQVNARARRYYDEFRLRAKSRAMKRRTREEQIFKHLFEEGMEIQKARIRELRKYAAEKREENSKRQRDEVESLENYYRDQFKMLAETIAKERQELNTRDREQANALHRIKRNLREKMEREIREYQDQLYRDEDAEYFRQLEADRMKHELQIAKYKAQL
ncbi:uncharacterized protein [Diadema setosum]|uniref:uncharacterized protein n=1 Tax=Diadema setosum TaxID=31175 RepID=UPI003B3B93ED